MADPRRRHRSALGAAARPRAARLFSVARLLAAAPFLATAPRGAPQAVIVLPGLGATDRSTIAIRRYLKFLGYQAHGWNRGRNVRPAGADLPAVAAQIRSLRDATGTAGHASSAGAAAASSPARRRASRPTRSRMVDHARQSVRRAGGDERRRRLAAPDRRGFPGADAGAVARASPRRCRFPAPRSTAARTASSPGGPAGRPKDRGARTWRCAARISGSASIPLRCGSSPTGWRSRSEHGRRSGRAPCGAACFRAATTRVTRRRGPS